MKTEIDQKKKRNKNRKCFLKIKEPLTLVVLFVSKQDLKSLKRQINLFEGRMGRVGERRINITASI